MTGRQRADDADPDDPFDGALEFSSADRTPHPDAADDPHRGISLHEGLARLDLSYAQLWERYAAVGGDRPLRDLRAHVDSHTCPDHHEHNLIAQALNDVFLESDRDHPVAYHHLFGTDQSG